MTTKTIAPPLVGEPLLLPEAQPAPNNLPATVSRAAIVRRSPQRLITVDLHCRVRWQMYRAEFRFNIRASLFICQTIKPQADTDVTATPRDAYSTAELRLTDVRCPGCAASVSFPACRFEPLSCDALGRAEICPGWCDALGLQGRP